MVNRLYVVARSALVLRDEAISHIARRLLRAKVHRPRNDIILFLLSSFLLFSCTTKTPQASLQTVSVYSTFAAEPWLDPLYACAESVAVISRVDDVSSADIVLRVGEPEFLASPAYQIDEEEIWVVAHHETPIPSMGLEGVQALFLGLGDPSIQIWVYASDTDVQAIFDQYVMEGRSVTSLARLATSPQEMADVLDSERQALGILPVNWSMKMSGSSGIYHVATVPVLAITKSEPQGAVNQLIGCLQEK